MRQKNLLPEEQQGYWALYWQERKIEQRNQLAWWNVRLVHKCVCLFQNHMPWQMEEEDLFQCGMMGLLEAVEKYDPHRNPYFSTYAFPKIYSQMQKGMMQSSGLSRNLFHKMLRYKNCRELLCQRLKRMPTHEEMAEELGLSWHKYQTVYQHLAFCHIALYGLQCPANSPDIEYLVPWEDIWLRCLLRSFLEQMPEEQRDMIQAYYYEEKSLRRISQERKSSRWKTEKCLREALAWLKNNFSIDT